MQADNSSLEKLLAAAARSLGTRPQDLQKAAQNGSLDQILQQANPQDAEKLLSTPQAQALFQMLMKGDKPHG